MLRMTPRWGEASLRGRYTQGGGATPEAARQRKSSREATVNSDVNLRRARALTDRGSSPAPSSTVAEVAHATVLPPDVVMAVTRGGRSLKPLTVSGKADLNIRGVVWAIDTGALHLQVDYSVGLVSVKAQGAVPLGDRSYHVLSGLS